MLKDVNLESKGHTVDMCPFWQYKDIPSHLPMMDFFD